MPKNEFDIEDPLELNGVALLTEEDTTDAMCECFIEELMRMGYDADQILALFCNWQYLGMNLVLKKRGEEFIRNRIVEVFARWGRVVEKPGARSPKHETGERQLVSGTGIATDPSTAGLPGAGNPEVVR